MNAEGTTEQEVNLKKAEEEEQEEEQHLCLTFQPLRANKKPNK